MPVHNTDIAAIFEEIADLLEIENANPFRVRAYRNAARTLQGLRRDVADAVQDGTLTMKIPGVGTDLAARIVEIVTTGKCQALERLRKSLAPGLPELLKLPGLGPKRVGALYHELDVHTPEQLYRALKDGRVSELHGFGAKTVARLVEALEAHVAQAPRFKLAVAAQYAEPYAEALRATPGVSGVVVAGSYRRCRETVGDLDLLAAATDSAPVMERFTGYDDVKEVLARGPTRATVLLRNNLQVDLRVVAPESFGAALHYFTGSKSHNIAVRRRGQQRGLKVSEYGVFDGGKRVAGETEESVFAAVGLPWIAPELREDRGEIEAAANGLLPKLVELADLRGDLHAHTKATDGHDTLREMARAAQGRGLQYLAITEHSRHLTVAHGLDQQRLLQQIAQIDELNGELCGFTLLKGIEVDILEDGALDLPDAVLEKLDLVVGAVHSGFNLSRAKQTQRILRAMDHPHFSILAHPSGRLLDQREPYDVDMARIIHHARERGCYLEVNAHPERLDLLDVYCRMAKEEGVMVSIGSDAHSVLDFEHLRYGVGQARRGWLEAGDVINTRPLPALRKLLRKTM
jgi:DNA polymerase (family 10)